MQEPFDASHFEKRLTPVLANDLFQLTREMAIGASGAGCYALIELGQCVPHTAVALVEQLRSHGVRIDAQVHKLFDLTPEAELADQGPWLIELPPLPSAALLRDLAALGGVHHALSLIASALPGWQLVRHLRGWMEGTIPADPNVPDDIDHGAVVRWFDPRIGFDLIAALPKRDRQQFLSGICWWAGWDVDFMPRLLRGTSGDECAPRIFPLLVDGPLSLALDRLNTPETMLALIEERDIEPGELDPISPVLRRRIAHGLLAEADHRGRRSWEDRYMLVALGLRVHPEISSYPQITPLLARAIDGTQSLVESVPAVAAAQWGEIATQAPQALSRISAQWVRELNERTPASLNPRLRGESPAQPLR